MVDVPVLQVISYVMYCKADALRTGDHRRVPRAQTMLGRRAVLCHWLCCVTAAALYCASYTNSAGGMLADALCGRSPAANTSMLPETSFMRQTPHASSERTTDPRRWQKCREHHAGSCIVRRVLQLKS